MTTIIVGLLGSKGHGKSTAADYLVKEFGYVELSFARPLKNIVKEVFTMSEDQVNNPDYKEKIDERWGVSPRELLQVIGTDLFRDGLRTACPSLESKDSIWITNLKYRLEALPTGSRVVISDVRFPEEATFLQSLGCILLRIQRPSISDTATTRTQHASETQSANIVVDGTVVNDGTKVQLCTRVYEALNKVLFG